MTARAMGRLVWLASVGISLGAGCTHDYSYFRFGDETEDGAAPDGATGGTTSNAADGSTSDGTSQEEGGNASNPTGSGVAASGEGTAGNTAAEDGGT
jgi:hypothetical protein